MASKPAKTLNEKIADADARGSKYLADANEASEKGNQAKAENLYAKGQYWLDRSNKLRGAGPTKDDGDLRRRRFHVCLSDAELKTIDDWRFENRVATRAEAVRQLCEIALKAEFIKGL